MKSVVRMVRLVLLLGVLAIALGWALLAMPLFADLRRPVLEKLLSEQIGQPLYIKEDARIVLGSTSHIHTGAVEIPSETIPNLILAELKILELDLNTVALLRGRIDLDNLVVDGLKVRLLTQKDGTQSWTADNRPELSLSALERSKNETQHGSPHSDGILDFLSDKTASFTSVGLSIDNRMTGFKFDFDLTKLNLDQIAKGGGLTVTSQGSVNGQAFAVMGNYPTGEAFTTTSTFGAVKLDFDGNPISAQQGGGFDGKLTLDTGEIGDFLEVLGLDRDLEGQANMVAGLRHQNGRLTISDMKTDINLSQGQKLTATGSVDDLWETAGIDLTFKGRLYPEGKPPAQATDLHDLKLTGISTHVVSSDDALEFQDMIVTTNAFDENLNRIGPVNIGRVFRGDDGNLMLEDISLQAGPQETPYVVAQGDIKDLLQLKDINFNGTMSIPASLVLTGLGETDGESLGGIDGTFAVDDAQGFLSLNHLDAHSVDTELWDLTTHAELGNVADFENLTFDLGLTIKDSAKFLEALKLKKVNAGPFKLSVTAQGKTENFSSALEISAGKSQVDATLDTSVAGDRPATKGRIFSKSVAIGDVKNTIAVVSQLGKFVQKRRSKEAKPKANATHLVEVEDFLLDQDVDIAIDIKKIVGQRGISGLSSHLTATNGLAKLGPLEITYDGGHFTGTAQMDMVKTPQLLSVSGTTRGWNLKDVLDAIGLSYAADGKLHGTFAFTGERRSVDAFVNSMRGSASVLMSNGGIATSLIELSGLGIFPWLFSEELRKGYSKITCLAAPVKIDAGKVSFDSFVAETAKVQLVARGALDWKKNSISVHAEARKLDKPLSRSAWPFEVIGTLSHPKIKLLVGGLFQKRRDGAKKLADHRKSCIPDINQLE